MPRVGCQKLGEKRKTGLVLERTWTFQVFLTKFQETGSRFTLFSSVFRNNDTNHVFEFFRGSRTFYSALVIVERLCWTSHSLLGALLIIFPTRSLKVMTISLQADGCMGGTVYYTSIHTESCHDSRIDMSQ